MRFRLAASARLFPLALAVAALAACLGAAAPAAAEAPGAARALHALLATQQVQLLAADGAAADQFGSAVAVSGDTAVVGAWWDDVGVNRDQGSAYVFVRGAAGWSQQAQLTAADGAAGDIFGRTVAISGDTIVVGASEDDEARGAAYVFVRSGATWSQQQKLTAADGATRDSFAIDVAISGDTVVVGSLFNVTGPPLKKGSAYVFVRSGSTWSEQARLTASDGVPPAWGSDQFGGSVAVSGDTAVVGAAVDDYGANDGQGSAYVYVRDGTTWSEQAKLLAADGAAGDHFGYAVAVSGSAVVVGAPYDDVSLSWDGGGGGWADRGSAYVYTRSGTTWSQQAQLLAARGGAEDYFGWSVGISGAVAVVGAYGTGVFSGDGGWNDDQGAAYLFTRSGATWSQQAQLTAADGAADDWFGYAVAVSGTTAVSASPLYDAGDITGQGSAYVFRIAKPARPTARSPKGRISSRTPSFRWRAAAGAAAYEVRVYKGGKQIKKKTGITKTSWKCTKRLPRRAWLTWKVRARNVAGYGAWSGKLRFRVR